MIESKEISVSVGISRHSDDLVYINIQDQDSRHNIIKTRFSLKSFAKLITGQGAIKGEGELFLNNDNINDIGMERISKHISVEKPKGYLGRNEFSSYINIEINKFLSDNKDWKLWDDGTRSRQDGEMHKATLIKYVTKKPKKKVL